MTLEYMRDYLLGSYPGPNWRRKVALMEDRQIVAVYYSIKEQEKRRPRRKKKAMEKAEQLSMMKLFPEVFKC